MPYIRPRDAGDTCIYGNRWMSHVLHPCHITLCLSMPIACWYAPGMPTMGDIVPLAQGKLARLGGNSTKDLEVFVV